MTNGEVMENIIAFAGIVFVVISCLTLISLHGYMQKENSNNWRLAAFMVTLVFSSVVGVTGINFLLMWIEVAAR